MDKIWKEYNRDACRRTGINISAAILSSLVACIVCVWVPMVVMIVY